MRQPRILADAIRKWCFPVLRRALLVGGLHPLIGGVASQPERPQPRSLFPHRAPFSLVLGHCLLALTQLLLFLEQRFGATMRLMHIRAQYRNSLVKPKMRITGSENRLFLG
jgi:hypothetical protein